MRYRRPPAMTGPSIPGLPRWILRAATWACTGIAALTTGSVAQGGEPEAGPPANLVLHLANGGFVTGKFCATDQPGAIRWQGNAFRTPFEFDLKAIDTIQAPVPARPLASEGAFRFELSGGDIVFGTLLKLDDNEAELELPRIGRMRVPRERLLRLERWQGRGDVVYLGPNGLTGWTPLPADGPIGWREESGELITDQEGAALVGKIPLPQRAALEFELSWKHKPDFVLALGHSETGAADEKAPVAPFRFEVWDQELVVQRETQEEADVASLRKLELGSGRVHLKVYLDQEQGRLVVDTPDGKPLAEMKVAASKPRVLTDIRLENRTGDLRLERLEVTQWNGELLREPLPDGPTLKRTNGSNLSARSITFDAESKSFVVADENAGEDKKEIRIPLDETARLTFSPLSDDPPRSVEAELQEGSRLSGNLVGIGKDVVSIKVPGVVEPVRLPINGLRSLVANHPQGTTDEKLESLPRLEMEGVRLVGHLIDGKNEGGASCLTWQPKGSATASILADAASGRILYKDPAPPVAKVTTTRQGNRVVVNNANIKIQVAQPLQPAPPQGGLQGFVLAFAGVAQERNDPGRVIASDSNAKGTSGRKALYLRTGDIIPAEVTSIDENGVTIRTSHSKDTVVPHARIKAVELSEEPITPVRLNKAKYDRLLTLPRVQKGSPPAHLIRSKNGDYLRGRVVGMDAKSIQIEVRLEVKTLPRDRIARIIWLQAEDLEAGKEKEKDKAPDQAPQPEGQKTDADKAGEPELVQALKKDGVRLTFAPEQFKEDTLRGTSPVLGACQVRIGEVDQLLIGKAIEKEAGQLTFQRWLLTDAPEPKVYQEEGEGPSEGGGDALSGRSSPLVGKPAPDFSLEQLGGKRFHLADAKGKVVVLDFWATWCGPCLQAMPQVEKVTGEFRDQGVMLVAVNLQESPKEISAMLERHKLNLTVALDKDGAVAEKYKANAIPQTVVIDREGNVSRLFVGGGPRLGDQLREAIQATLGGADADPKGPGDDK